LLEPGLPRAELLPGRPELFALLEPLGDPDLDGPDVFAPGLPDRGLPRSEAESLPGRPELFALLEPLGDPDLDGPEDFPRGAPDDPPGLPERDGPLPLLGAADREERGGLRPAPERDPEDLSAPLRRSPPCWAITTSTNTSMAGQSPGPPSERMSGGVLLSHPVTRAVPSAQKGLASGFGMGPGVSPSLLPPKLYGDINRSRPYLGNRIVNACRNNVSQVLGLLVPVSSTHRCASTSGLSTQSSSWGPYQVNPVGVLILKRASRLDAFSGYHFRT
jgi:hypothetical protein